MIYYKPVTLLADDSLIEFLPEPGEDYLDLTHTMLSILRIRVESDCGESTSVASDGRAKIGPVNHLLHSMFNQIDIFQSKARIAIKQHLRVPHVREALLNYASFRIKLFI